MDSIRRAVPNVITMSAMTCGILAMVMDDPWFILIACILDKLDGTVARLLRVESAFGAELDSFADFISFGVAPAFAMRHAYLSVKVVYILATSCRLAKFNVTESVPFFMGVPSTLAGLIVASLSLTLDLGQVASSVVLVTFTWLMNSPIRISKFGSAPVSMWVVVPLATATMASIATRTWPVVPLVAGCAGLAIGIASARKRC